MLVRSGISLLPAHLPLSSDELLLSPEVAWESYGEYRPGNAVLLLHGLSHSYRAAGLEPRQGYSPHGWFQSVIADQRGLDPAQYHLISANLLGSPFGSSSPLTLDMDSGKPMLGDFPRLSVTDMARAAAGLVRSMGIQRLRAVIGVSLGGMVALRMSTLFPELTQSVAILGTTACLPEVYRRKLASVRQVLASDHAFNGGYYAVDRPPTATMTRLRLELLRDLYGRDWLLRTWGDLFQVERALEAEAGEFAAEFDPMSYAVLCEAYAHADLHETLGPMGPRTLVVASSSDALAPPERVRDTYHRLMASGRNARYYELQTDAGHRGFYLDGPKVGELLRDFVGTPVLE